MTVMEYIQRWVDEAVKNKFLALKESTSEDKKLYESIDKTLDKLKFNPYRGESLKKDRIPKIYKQLYGLNNLFKININQYWRLMYFVKSLDRERTLIILIDFMPHSEYDKLLGYK